MIDAHQDNKQNSGFTLIEIILVGIILLIIAGLTFPNLSVSKNNFQLRETVNNLATYMRYAQGRAVAQVRHHRLEFDYEFKKYWITQESEESFDDENKLFERITTRLGRKINIADNLTIEANKQIIDFREDGYVDPVRIYICLEDQCYTISTQDQAGYIRVYDFRLS